MPDRELSVYMDGLHAGTASQTGQGNTTFTYDPVYRESPTATPLSLSMPLTLSRHPSRVVTPFLQGLLPDNPGRLAQLATEYRTSTNPFALLAHVGRDAAGAIQLLPAGEAAKDAVARQGDIEPHSADDFSAIVRDIIDNADTWGRRDLGGRWSLPGAQPKVALFRFEDGTWGTPRDSTPTTHILKPAVPPYSHHDVNEYVTMSAAARLGLHVADHAVEVTTAGDHVFASRRYDRARLDDRWERLHQEDLCQALSVSPDRKYQADGGPGIAQIAILFQDAIRDLESRKRTQERFFEALVFAVAAACTDAHAKNYSLMLRGRSVHLAPLYDLGTHAPYPSTAPLKSAMKIGDEYRIDAIGERELMTAARKLRVPDEWAEERIATICNGLAEAFADAATELDDPFARGVADSVAAIADARGWV